MCTYRPTWKIHLFTIITVTLKPHHWRIANMDRITLHWHKILSSMIFLLFLHQPRSQFNTINQFFYKKIPGKTKIKETQLNYLEKAVIICNIWSGVGRQCGVLWSAVLVWVVHTKYFDFRLHNLRKNSKRICSSHCLHAFWPL